MVRASPLSSLLGYPVDQRLGSGWLLRCELAVLQLEQQRDRTLHRTPEKNVHRPRTAPLCRPLTASPAPKIPSRIHRPRPARRSGMELRTAPDHRRGQRPERSLTEVGCASPNRCPWGARRGCRLHPWSCQPNGRRSIFSDGGQDQASASSRPQAPALVELC